jgi:hypothetical protein
VIKCLFDATLTDGMSNHDGRKNLQYDHSRHERETIGSELRMVDLSCG